MQETTIKKTLSNGSEIELTAIIRPAGDGRIIAKDVLEQETTEVFKCLLLNLIGKITGYDFSD